MNPTAIHQLDGRRRRIREDGMVNSSEYSKRIGSERNLIQSARRASEDFRMKDTQSLEGGMNLMHVSSLTWM